MVNKNKDVELGNVRMENNDEHVKLVAVRSKIWVPDLCKKKKLLVNITDGPVTNIEMRKKCFDGF